MYIRLLIISALLCIFLIDTYAQKDNTWLEQGHNYHRQALTQQALEYYNIHIDIYPEDPIGYIYRAKLYEAMGRQKESQIDIKIAQRLNPLSLMIVDPAIRSKYSAKRAYEFNFQELDDAFVKSPSRYQDYEEVLRQLDSNHAQDTVITQIIDRLNNFDVARAERLLNSIDSSTSSIFLVYDLYGKVNMKKGNYEEAIQNFTDAIETNPLFPIAYHNRSICYKNLGQYAEAERDLQKAIELNDNIASFYFTMAKLNEKLGMERKALSNYRKALDKDQNYQEALINYSQLLKGLGDYGEGMKYFKQAISETKNESEREFQQANLNFIYGEFNLAIDGYERYLRSYPNDPSAIFNLGLSKLLLRQTDEGCEDLMLSISLDDNEKYQNIHELFCTQILNKFMD